jgi:hypothetical protein
LPQGFLFRFLGKGGILILIKERLAVLCFVGLPVLYEMVNVLRVRQFNAVRDITFKGEAGDEAVIV